MKKTVFFFLLAINLLAYSCLAEEPSKNTKLKVFSYWLVPTIDPSQMRSLSLFDGVIVSHGNLWNNPMTLLGLKTGQYVYVNPWEIHAPPYPDQRLDNKVFMEITSNRPEYFLQGTEGESVVFWPGMKVLNMSTNCPVINGQQCWEYLADVYISDIINNKVFASMSGLYIDNPHRSVSWLKSRNGSSPTIDSNKDGKDDDRYFLDEAWEAGIRKFLEKIKGALKNKQMIGNNFSLEFNEFFDINFLENFPDQQGGLDLALQVAQMKSAIVHVSSAKSELGAACALLYDGYLAIGQEDQYQAAYDLDLGRPKGPAERKGDVITRRFQRGEVTVDIKSQKAKISKR